jgi:cytochrome c553
MTDQVRDTALRSAWGMGAVFITAVLAVLAIIAGLVVLPYANPNAGFAGLWDAICSAAGVPARRASATPAAEVGPRSEVAVVSGMLTRASPESIGRGATLALQCAICHGPGGVSESQFPNLAGQYAAAVYKQLRDFKSGARANAVMVPFAAAMSERDMVDVAAYYASLPPQPAAGTAGTAGEGAAPPRIITYGDPLRGIAPCGACHGAIDAKVASPWLSGQPSAYVQAQLDAFATGARTNDIGGQMRNIARRMTPEEIRAAAQFFSAQSRTSFHAAE